jgi:hypothetical protein
VLADLPERVLLDPVTDRAAEPVDPAGQPVDPAGQPASQPASTRRIA